MAYKTIGDLFKAIENEKFAMVAGPLVNYIPYQIIRDLLYDQMLEPLPQKYIDQYQMNRPPSQTLEELGDE